jgi:predicted dehydrogenase
VWDLAPHDISIIAYLLGAFPDTIRAMGRSHTASMLEDVCYLHMEYDKGPIVHVHLNWIAPAKVRQMIIGGTKKMLVFDDNQASEKIRLYDKGINFSELGADALNKIKIQYRTGDIVIPQISSNEALADEIQHFAQCLDKSISPQSGGSFGMSVCRVLEAADESLANQSALIRIDNHA